MKSCILERISAASCDTVLERSGSHEILSVLVKKNLFISCTNEEREIFCYHPLFRNFLLNRLSQEGEEIINPLHLKAALYFKSVKDYNNSVEHYFSAKNIKGALELIESQGKNLIKTRKFNILEQWLKKLPPEIIQKSLTLLFYQGTILYYQGEWDLGMKVLKKAKQGFAKEKRGKELSKAISRMMDILSYQGDYTKAIILGKRGLEVVREKLSRLKSKVRIGRCYFYSKNIPRAMAVFSECLKDAKRINDRMQGMLSKKHFGLVRVSIGREK